MHRSLIAVPLLAAALAVPAAASASTVTAVLPSPTASKYNLTFTGGNRVNDVVFDGRAFKWSDAAQPLKALGACVAGLPVICPAGVSTIDLDGGDDRLRIAPNGALDTYVYGGAGADDITADSNVLSVWGEGGPDTIDATANGYVDADGGPGADHVRGGKGNASGSNLTGGDGNDLLVGYALVKDIINGGDGNDDVFVTYAQGVVDGGAGADVIVQLGLQNRALSAIGGAGADTIVGGPRADTIDGGANGDTIDVANDPSEDPEYPTVDTVTCGSGDDTVYANPEDSVAANCEHVITDTVPNPHALPRVQNAVDHLLDVWPTHPTGGF